MYVVLHCFAVGVTWEQELFPEQIQKESLDLFPLALEYYLNARKNGLNGSDSKKRNSSLELRV